MVQNVCCVIWYNMCANYNYHRLFLFPLQHMGIYLVNWNLAISQSHSLSEIDRERKEQPNAPISLSPKIGDRCKGIYIIPLARTFLALAALKTHASSLRLSTAYAVIKTNPYMPVCVAARSKHWPQRRHRCFMCLGCQLPCCGGQHQLHARRHIGQGIRLFIHSGTGECTCHGS
jgi:hypothetical protein